MARTTGSSPSSDAPVSTARSRLKCTPELSRPASLHGAWWPRSHEAHLELPDLIRDLDARRGEEVTCIILAPTDWEDRSPRLRAVDRIVRVGWFTTQPDSLVTATFADHPHLQLLVIPPETEPALAEAAMVMAAAPGNAVAAHHILAMVAATRSVRWCSDPGVAGRGADPASPESSPES